MTSDLKDLLRQINQSDLSLLNITEKITEGQRISADEAMVLYQKAGLPLLGCLANFTREQRFGREVYFVRNIHVEYTNKCVNLCAFCAFRSKSDDDAWEMNADDILQYINRHAAQGINEIHIVGGIHPDRDIHFWLPVISAVKKQYPAVHIKAFTAVELDYLTAKAGLSVDEGLQLLKTHGLDSIPGGGAEIFDNALRSTYFPTKISWQRWLQIHRTAHLSGIPSNATMLYGHAETPQNRIFHLSELRKLQDETGGFNAFIPLKYKHKNNDMTGLGEVPMIEDLRVFALSRIFLDNIPHIKAYWPMLGMDTAMLAMNFGADDLDGTINDTTAIYTRAGAAEQKPALNTEKMVETIRSHHKIPVERDALYRKIMVYKQI